MGDVPLYLPHNYPIWLYKYYSYVPDLFAQTFLYFLGASLLFLFLALLLNKDKEKNTLHGSAHWAEPDEVKNMELISAFGVVCGLYDSPFKQRLTALLHWLENEKKVRTSYAELHYYRRREKEGLPEKPYDPWQEHDYIVWLFSRIYSWYFSMYKGLDHFYLRDDSNRHMIVVAPTRSGKGVGLIVPTLLGSWNSSVIINDIKGENWGLTAGWRKRMGQVVIKFEPTSRDGSTARWNPLDEIRMGQPEEWSDAVKIAQVIADHDGTGKIDHWISSAAELIEGVIMHLKYAHYADPEHYPDRPNLSTVASFLKASVVEKRDENGNIAMIKGKPDSEVVHFLKSLESLRSFQHIPNEGLDIEEYDDDAGKVVKRHITPEDINDIYHAPLSRSFPNVHPRVYEVFEKTLNTPANECGSIVSTANTALQEYLDPILSGNMSVSDFYVNEIMNYQKPVSLFLVIPPSDIRRLSPIIRLFFEIVLIRHVAKCAGYENGQAFCLYKHKLLLLMDEFPAIGKLDTLSKALPYLAGFGLKVFLVTQGRPQISEVYGKDNQIIMNCHTKIIFAPNDEDTGKWVETLLGNETKETHSSQHKESLLGKPFEDSTITQGYTSRPLMTADEVVRMGDREIIQATTKPPLRTEKIRYYEMKYFTDRLKDAPVVSDVIHNSPNPARNLLLKRHRKEEKARKKFRFIYSETRRKDG